MGVAVSLTILVATGGKKPLEVELFWRHMTHKGRDIAIEAGLYKPIWRPGELGVQYANELIGYLTKGLEVLQVMDKRSPSSALPMMIIGFVEEYLEACKEYPIARVRVTI